VLEARAPKTAAFIKSIHNKVSTITDIMSDGFTLYWDDFDADHYNVIVNDEVVKTTTNLSAVVEGLDSSTMYEVKVESVDKNRSEEHTSELQSRFDLVCRLLLE